MRYPISRIVLGIEDIVRGYPGMTYNASGAVDYSEKDDSLAFEGAVSFLTYFNALSYAKWNRYASIGNASLHLELSGDACAVQLAAVNADGASKRFRSSKYARRIAGKRAPKAEPAAITSPYLFEGSAEFRGIDIPVPAGDWILVGLELESTGATEIRNAFWYTDVEEASLRPARIAIAMTTFRKERYALENIQRIRDALASIPTGGDFHLYVIDNGRTLDAGGMTDKAVTVIPNANVGGSGGFARGMIAAMESECIDGGERFTHVLLMDDDVIVFPESLFRTKALLSLLNENYKDAFLNGAMLDMKRPNLQFEDVASVVRGGHYVRVKGDYFVDSLDEAVANELADVEVPRAYGAWWYSCIPMSAIKEKGLPLPFFVRIDDVEFGLRNRPVYMTLNGICVWHDSFDDKFNPVMLYQSYRNQLIADAVYSGSMGSHIPLIMERALRTQLRNLNYGAAELIVKAMEDYLEGPSFLMDADPEALLEEHAGMVEKLMPLEEAISKTVESHPELEASLRSFKPDMTILEEASAGNMLPLRALRVLPYDKHLLPERVLRDMPVTAYHGESTSPDFSTVGASVIVAFNRDGDQAVVRIMDKERYSRIMQRWHDALKRFKKNEYGLRKHYKAAMAEMSSVPFWKGYLDRMNSAEGASAAD